MPASPTPTSTGPVARSALVTEPTHVPVFVDSGTGLYPRAVEATVGSVSGYIYLGCYSDDASSRLVASASQEFAVINNPAECCAFCANLDTALSMCGVEFGSQCFCGSQLEATTLNSPAAASECSATCLGYNNLQCGGISRINVYSATVDIGVQTTVAATPTPAIVPGYRYLGCVSDSTARLLTRASTTGPVFMNPELCCNLCLNSDNGNVLCGVENADECYCDNLSATGSTLLASAADCSMPCAGHGDELCGGSYRINLYAATGPVKVDPATLGLPYDPETNVEDASLQLTVALPQTFLRNDAVFIKEFFDYCLGSETHRQRWFHEVRMLEFLARKHPHPNFVRYLGCRVIEVPGDTATEDVPGHAGQKRKRVQKRITGIVLEKAQYCMRDYDPDDDNWSRILDPAIFLKRLEAAVFYLHSVGLAHNDLKPGNVMVRADGQPVLIDFESCAPSHTELNTDGTPNWSMRILSYMSSFENDLYALRLFRERNGDKEARDKYFRGH
ncbi:hypothetical protein SCUCBS95973_005071 [Sporothrix curviconia]|uniref:Protein kinase domain-containing protein n=1 Tax=Sporothrix curviconia TaxID=1260050 RepID=A0ABP0BTX9_9PEZI